MRQFLLYNPCLTVAMLSWVIAQTLKLILSYAATRQLDFKRLVDTGGMPSSHTAFVVSLAISVGQTSGWSSSVFAIAACFAMVVLYDATSLRRSAGYHAQVLNDIVPALLAGKILKDGFTFPKLRELLGHNPYEVAVGGLLGVGISLWFHQLIFPSSLP
jgi:uncharacterized protein